jgi:hypothetical protein
MGKKNNSSIGNYVKKLLATGAILGTITGGLLVYAMENYDDSSTKQTTTISQTQYENQGSDDKPLELEIIAKDDDKEHLGIALDKVVNSPVNMKNFAFVGSIENKNLYQVLNQYCTEKGVNFEDALPEYWAESMLTQVVFNNNQGTFTPLESIANAFGFTQMTKIAVDDLNQKGYKNRDGQAFDWEEVKHNPYDNIYAGVSFLKLIDENYLIPNGIEPNKWNRAFSYLIGPPKAKDILNKYGYNPKEYVDNLENIIGKNAANDVKYYFAFMEMYDKVSKEIKWPMKGSYDINIIEENGQMKGMELNPKEDKTLYASLPGKVTVAGEVPNRYGSMANGLWVQTKYIPVEGYGPIKTSYIKLDSINEGIEVGKWIEPGTPLGIIGENTQKWDSYSNEDDRGFPINVIDFHAKDIFNSYMAVDAK